MVARAVDQFRPACATNGRDDPAFQIAPMRLSEVFVLGDDQHRASEKLLRLIPIMRRKASLNLIAFTDIDELTARQIRVWPYQQIDARSRRLFPADKFRQRSARGNAARTEETPSSAVMTPDGVPSTR